MGYLNNKKRLAIFASGSGSNAERICQYFLSHPNIQVSLIFSNNEDAGVFNRLKAFAIPSVHLTNQECSQGDQLTGLMRENKIDFIALAGYLRLIPKALVDAFPQKIINIHPALLPKYGGKGMYGHHVHQAVFVNNEVESGLTIHFVNNNFDEGAHICQVKTDISDANSSNEIAQQVLRLEHQYFPAVIEQVMLNHPIETE
jgi:phosphoribosylglycinamide formyltransferase-1